MGISTHLSSGRAHPGSPLFGGSRGHLYPAGRLHPRHLWACPPCGSALLPSDSWRHSYPLPGTSTWPHPAFAEVLLLRFLPGVVVYPVHSGSIHLRLLRVQMLDFLGAATAQKTVETLLQSCYQFSRRLKLTHSSFVIVQEVRLCSTTTRVAR